MKPYYEEDGITIICGDVREQLPYLAPASVHCCVTSPPYWGLRDYGAQGQIGLEARLLTSGTLLDQRGGLWVLLYGSPDPCQSRVNRVR